MVAVDHIGARSHHAELVVGASLVVDMDPSGSILHP